MKIQSRFKDYYDYIGHKYGSDPYVVYIREPIKKTEIDCKGLFYDDVFNERSEYFIRFIIAGSNVVPFVCYWEKQEQEKWIDPNSFTPSVLKYERFGEQHHSLLRKSWRLKGQELEMPKYPTGEKLNDLIRLVGAPVFEVKEVHHEYVIVSERIPILNDLGFPSFISAEAMWQDIYATLTNVLRKNPDKEPPVKVEEKYRIHAAGFDLKTSFRHPINKKPK
jgi:hypothetical protein